MSEGVKLLSKVQLEFFAITDIRQEWQEFYRKYFCMTVDFSDVVIPYDPGGFDQVIFIPKGLTFTRVVKALRKQFKVYLSENLDKDVIENVRIADRNYAFRINERQMNKLKNFSANWFGEHGILVIIPLEQLVCEFKYWSERGEQDIQSITLSTSTDSRYSGGLPNVWYDEGGEVHIEF